MKHQQSTVPIRLRTGLSPHTYNLICLLLNRNPAHRPSIHQVVAHPAFTERLAEFRKPIRQQDVDVLIRNYQEIRIRISPISWPRSTA